MDKAKLFNKLLPFELVVFDINPNKVTMTKGTVSRNVAAAGPSNPTGSSPPIWRQTPPTELTLTNVYVDGPEVKNRADQLLGWTMPGGSFFGKLAGAALGALSGGRLNLTVNQPVLTFLWGPPGAGFVMDCVVENVAIDFLRFEPSGIPTRMVIKSLKLKEVPNLLLQALTNPTSGGLPGRESHRVSEGENLPLIATRSYGQPQYWRAVAEANGIDDPLRTRPGDLVYLPAPSEVAGGGPSGW